MRVAGCFLQYNDKFLILLRNSTKPDGDTWGLPGGKVEANETDEEAIVRELFEETGYQASPPELEHLGDFQFVSQRGEAFIYATFRIVLEKAPSIRLESSAHSTFEWVTPEECIAKDNLISDFDSLIQLVGYMD